MATKSWKDNLRPASFRGVPFRVDVSQFTTGRRLSVHEYPDRDIPYTEDLGRVGKAFKIEGHLLGDDYFDQRNAIIEAVEKEGPGELIHPYYGTLQVQCGPVSFDEDTKEGRIVKVSFQFYEAGNNQFPKTIDDKSALLKAAGQKSLLASIAEFNKKFSITKLPGHLVDTARGWVAKATDAYKTATAGVQGSIQDIANLAYSIRNLKAETNDLLKSPSKLSARLLDSLALLEKAVSLPRGRLQAYSALFAFTGGNDTASPTLQTTTPSNIKSADNQEHFDNLQRRAAIIGAINQVPDITFDSVEEAQALQEKLTALIEDQLLNCKDDDVFAAFEDLRAALVKVLPDVDSQLPNIQKIKVIDTTPAIVIAYDSFGRPELEEDIVVRNKIRHPGFVIGGTELEVVNE